MKLNKKPVIAYLFSHWDPEWYRTVSAFNVRLIEIMDKVLAELDNGDIPCFYLDGQVLMLKNYLDFRPEKEKIIKKFIKEKKLHIGPFYASSDNFLVSGASLIKNVEIGINYSKKFGEREFIGYLSDTFGHSKGIFEILKYFDIKNAIIWRGAPDIVSDFIANGVKTTRLVYGYYQDILNCDCPIEKKAEMIKKTLDKISSKSQDIILLPLGGDHLQISDNIQKQIKEINKLLCDYEIKIKSPFEYLKKADFKTKELNCEFLDNSNTYILPGVYSCRIDEKCENAKLQFELFNKISLFNRFTGNKYKAEINYATEELIKNHAHDSIYGCSLDNVHKMVRARQLKVKETIDAIYGSLIRDFKDKNLIKENADKIGVFNFSCFEQENGTASVISDKKIKNAQKIRTFKSVSDEIFYNPMKNPMTEDFHNFYEYLIEIDSIKEFSFKNFEIKKPEIRHTLDNDFIENDFIKLFVYQNKIFAIDKKTNKIYEDFIQIHSTKDGGDSYNYAPCSYPCILKLKKSKILSKGCIKSTLQLIFDENIKLNFSIFNKLDYIQIDADFVNKKKNRKLQIVFNLDKEIKTTTAEDCIGTIKRAHKSDYLLYENMPVKNKEELKTGSYPMQRFVCAHGLAVFTVGLNEYETYKNSLKITLLRSIGIISNPKNKARGVPAGPPIECTEMQGIGEHNLKLAFSFNKEDLFKKADSFYNPYIAILGEFKNNKTYFKNDSKGVFYGLSKENKPIYYTNGILI